MISHSSGLFTYGVWSEQREKIIRKRFVLSAATVEKRLADAGRSYCATYKGSWPLVPTLSRSIFPSLPLAAPNDLSEDLPINVAVDYFLQVTHSVSQKSLTKNL
jgi:hypothetical protein